MITSIEAIVESNGVVHLLKPVKLNGSRRAILTILEDQPSDEIATFLSEQALAEDWLKPEEEKAWEHLQKAK
ncbi:MAG: hypothetical protein HY073_03205 [Deltaproteobacteria bacterium]|nr:hypothetical protein [Deltaproteobacteria bacterium]